MPAMPIRLLFSTLFLSAVAAAHPTFSSSSVVNAASFMPTEVPGGAIARGSIFSVFGSEIGPAEFAVQSGFPLSETLAGVSIEIAGPAGERAAVIPVFVSQSQLNAIMPSDAPLGEAQLTIRFDDDDGVAVSSPITIRVVEASFGMFTATSSGQGQAIATAFFSQQDQPLNSTRESSRPGDVVILWGTGLGATDGSDRERPIDVGGVVDLQDIATVEVFFGSVAATKVLYAGRSAEFPGLDQLIVELPANVPIGCYVPVRVRVAGSIVSNSVSISVSPRRGACEDPLNPYLGPDKFGSSAIVSFTRNVIESDGAEDITDTALGHMQQLATQPWYFNPALSAPALGTCATYVELNRAGGLSSPAPLVGLDGGIQLIVRGPLGARSIPRLTTAGVYQAQFGTSRQPPTYLEAGEYMLEGSGGSDVGPFNATFSLPDLPDWTNQDELDSVDRSVGATLTWTPADTSNHYVRIVGISNSTSNENNNVSATFVCAAPADAGEMLISPEVLANVPNSSGDGSATGLLLIGLSPVASTTEFEADGLDHGFVHFNVTRGRPIQFNTGP